MNLECVLESLSWAEQHFGALATNRACPRRDVMRAVKNGYAESAGIVAVCDGDGFTVEPERYVDGFKLSEKGRQKLQQIRESYRVMEEGTLQPEREPDGTPS